MRIEPSPSSILQILITRRSRDSRPSLEFRLHGAKGDREYLNEPFGETLFDRDPQPVLGDLGDEIEVRGRETDARKTESWLRSRGRHWYRHLIPEKLRTELRTLATFGGSLQVTSEEAWLPWELFHLSEDDGEETRFLVEAFDLARWFPQTPPVRELPLSRVAVVRCSERLNAGEAEEQSLRAHSEHARRRVELVPARWHEVTAALGDGRYDGWHFITHGSAARRLADDVPIQLDDDPLDPLDLENASRGVRARRPFVFLNACHSGRTGDEVVGLGGWPRRLAEHGAGGVLGPLWAIDSEEAAAFAGLFYDHFFRGRTLGESVRLARLDLRDRFPAGTGWVSYALYGDPSARCRRRAEDPTPTFDLGSAQRKWKSKHEYSKLSPRLATAPADEFETLALRFLRPALGPSSFEPTWLEPGVWTSDEDPPYRLVIAIFHFPVRGEELGPAEASKVEDALGALIRSGLDTEQLLVVHNCHGGSRSFREAVTAVLRDLERSGTVSEAALWTYRHLLHRAFDGMYDHLLAESRRQSLSLRTVAELLGDETTGEEPLERVPVEISTLRADQHRLTAESPAVASIADPAALVTAQGDRGMTLLLGGFGFGKTTAIARALRAHEADLVYVPAAALDEEISGAKDLLVRCFDADRVLAALPVEDRADLRPLIRPASERAFKEKKLGLLLVLDGLDEAPLLNRSGSLQTLLNSLWEVPIPTVLAMRSEFWDAKRRDFETGFGQPAGHGERRVRSIQCIELSSWRDEEIREFISRARAALPDTHQRRRLSDLAAWLDNGTFFETYGDIPRRPLFLRMIVDTVAALGLPDGRIGRARLLVDAVETKIRRDVAGPLRAGGRGRPSILGPAMDLDGVVHLSWRAMTVAAASMTREESGELVLLRDCPYQALRDGVPSLRDQEDPLPLTLHSLLRLCAPPSPSRPSRVRFSHRAFQEFFLAWSLLECGGSLEKAPASVRGWARDLEHEGLGPEI